METQIYTLWENNTAPPLLATALTTVFVPSTQWQRICMCLVDELRRFITSNFIPTEVFRKYEFNNQKKLLYFKSYQIKNMNKERLSHTSLPTAQDSYRRQCQE